MYTVAASQPASGWPRAPSLITYTSPLPPPHMGPGSVNQHSSHVDGQPASAHNLPALYIHIATYHPNKASIRWTTVRYCTCSYRYLYGVGRYDRVCTCTATKLLMSYLFFLLLAPRTGWLAWPPFNISSTPLVPWSNTEHHLYMYAYNIPLSYTEAQFTKPWGGWQSSDYLFFNFLILPWSIGCYMWGRGILLECTNNCISYNIGL